MTETKRASRWKEVWKELELLGRGTFGSVVKARYKMDSLVRIVSPGYYNRRLERRSVTEGIIVVSDPLDIGGNSPG